MTSFHIRPKWYLSESLATPESAYLNRRQMMRSMGLGALGLATLAGTQIGSPRRALGQDSGDAKAKADEPPSLSEVSRPAIGRRFGDRFPAPRNAAFDLGGRPLTEEVTAATNNNFYEFTTAKERVWKVAKDFTVDAWQIQVKGHVKEERTFAMEDLFTRFPLEERLYRFRCVERWAMQVPWTGFPLAALIDWLEPLPSARYVKFTSLEDKVRMPGIDRYGWYPWPYYEALRLDEARHPLAFAAVGIYGHALPMQHGAPWRLALPWKYGYKSPKSIVEIEFTKRRPKTFWNETQPREYGFFSNCDPSRPHPRWSQEWEQDIGTLETRATLPYNGYESAVAELYTGREV